MAKVIRLSDVLKYARLQCTQTEAASMMEISQATFRKLLRDNPKVKDAWERGREQGKVSLRRKQNALAGANAAMAIWLGKQYLKQDDVSKLQLTGEDGGPVEIADVTKLDANERKELRRLLQKADTPGPGQS